MLVRASVARSTRVGSRETANARVMWLQNSTEMPIACDARTRNVRHIQTRGNIHSQTQVFPVFTIREKINNQVQKTSISEYLNVEL